MPADAAFSSSIDVAQIVLYAFWIFFAGLVWYLHREDKREGYAFEKNAGDFLSIFVPPTPSPKTFILPHGGTVQAPRSQEDEAREMAREIAAEPVAVWAGAPLQPTGNPMRDGVGPASYALRAEEPDLDAEGHPKIVPLATLPDYWLEARDPDPRGMTVIAGDGKPAGKVVEAWIDRGELLMRYLEVETNGGRRVLLPTNFARIGRSTRQVKAKSIMAEHFEHVPALANPALVTRREEDMILAYYASGHLYAKPSRMGPIL